MKPEMDIWHTEIARQGSDSYRTEEIGVTTTKEEAENEEGAIIPLDRLSRRTVRRCQNSMSRRFGRTHANREKLYGPLIVLG